MSTYASGRRYHMADWLDLPTSKGAAPFIKTITSTSGNAKAEATAKGQSLELSADSEVQNVCVSMGDVLSQDIDDIQRVYFLLELGWGGDPFPGEVDVSLGLAAARNDDPLAMAQYALFRLKGAATLLLGTKDGTITTPDFNTGVVVPKDKLFGAAIDFSTEIQSVAPPGISKGGKGNVSFFFDDVVTGLTRPVGQNQLFDMSNYAGGLQFFAQIQKTAATSTASLHVKDYHVVMKDASRPPQPA